MPRKVTEALVFSAEDYWNTVREIAMSVRDEFPNPGKDACDRDAYILGATAHSAYTMYEPGISVTLEETKYAIPPNIREEAEYQSIPESGIGKYAATLAMNGDVWVAVEEMEAQDRGWT